MKDSRGRGADERNIRRTEQLLKISLTEPAISYLLHFYAQLHAKAV